MTRIKLRYYVIKRGKGFWQPTPKIKAHGFASVPCGVDGPDAWKIVEIWNNRWDAARRGDVPSPAMAAATNLSPDQAEELSIYPSRSLGEAFRRYRRTDEWQRKAPRTREDWWRAWRRIKPIFGDCDPRTVTLENLSAWRKAIQDTVSLREAHRAMKIWRAMWKVSAALGYCIRDADPSLGVRNTAAAGRSLTWTEGEAARLFKRAWRESYFGLAAAIAVAWDTQLSPGDVHALRASQLRRAASGAIFFAERGERPTNQSVARSRGAGSSPWRPICSALASNSSAMHRFSARAATRRATAVRGILVPTPVTYCRKTFGRCGLLNLARLKTEPWPTSGALALSRLLPAMLHWPPWHTPWATP